MSKHDDQFLPEQVDEQIDALESVQVDNPTYSSDARLVANLHQVSAEDSALLKRVRTRLETYRVLQRKNNSNHAAPLSRPLQHTDAPRQKGPYVMKSLPDTQKNRRKLVRTLELVAAVLIAAILVGSTTLLLHSRQAPGQGKARSATPTPAASPTSVTVKSQNALYAATQNGLARLDLTTGKVVWQSGSGTIDNVFVDGNIVVFASGNSTSGSPIIVNANGTTTITPPTYSSNYYVEGVNASTGKKIWSIPYLGNVLDLQGANGIVYVNANDLAGPSHIDALKTSNGAKLWSHPSSLGAIWELYQDGVVYGISYADFFALNATTGTPLWQKNLQAYAGMSADVAPAVSNGVMYFPACSQMKEAANYGDCDLFAFNAVNGSLLWHIPFGNLATTDIVPLVVANGALYIPSLDGTIHALNPQNGATLWTYATGGNISEPVLVGQNTLYIEAENETQTGTNLLALNVTTTSHTVAWSKSLGNLSEIVDFPSMLLENNLLYAFDNTAIQVFQADTGTPAQAYQTTTQLAGSFVVVWQPGA